VVIANAGVSKAWPAVHEAKIEDMREHFEINVLVVYFTCVVPEVGVSLRELLPGDDLPWLTIRDDVC